MADFQLERSINDCLKECWTGPTSRGPAPRWQRKQAERSGLPLSPVDMNSSTKSNARTPNGSKSFNKSHNSSKNISKTPKKTPGKSTPKNNTSNETSYDRFIPNRALMDVNRSHHLLMKQDTSSTEGSEKSCSNTDYEQCIRENFGDSDADAKILTMSIKAPMSKDGHSNNMKVLYSQGRSKGPKTKSVRHIPTAPERILDAPDMADDYYLNLLDWGSNNCLSVALDGAVFIWNAGTGAVSKLMQLNEGDYISSVRWIGVGNVLAVGLSNGIVELWDTDQEKRVRSMSGHASRVASLSWNSHILSSGNRSGAIYHHDVRVASHHVATLSNHSQEVCGLQWSPDGTHLASGGNDNLVNVWDERSISNNSATSPLQTFAHHMAAVKAVSWCPWQRHILGTGGGTADRHMRIWNASSGVCIQSLDTDSQVSGILWSEEHKEIVTGHGFSRNQLSIWKYPSMERVTDLTGHTARVLHLAQSPDQTTIASAAADETLRLWKCFGVDKKKERTRQKKGNAFGSVSSSMNGLIR